MEANFPEGHNSRRFFSEISRCAADQSFDNLVCALMQSPVLSVNVDEGVQGTGYFAIRVHFLDESCCPTSSFWQMRHVSGKTHDILCEQVLLSLTTQSHKGNGLTKQHVLERLVGFSADGASVNGVRKGSTPVAAPIRGTNLAHKLLEEKAEYTQESILVCWPQGSNGVQSVGTSLLYTVKVANAIYCSHPVVFKNPKSQQENLLDVHSGAVRIELI